MKKYLIILLIAFQIVFLQETTEQTSPADNQYKLTTSVNKSTITIGEKIYLTVIFSQPANEQIIPLPLITENLGDFIIKDYQIINSDKNNSIQTRVQTIVYQRVQTIVYQITTYKTGALFIPSIKLTIQNSKQNSKIKTNHTNNANVALVIRSTKIPIQVVSLIDTNQIDYTLEESKLTPQVKRKLNKNIYYFFIILSIFLLGFAIYYFFKRRQRPPPIPFYILILKQLNSLEKDSFKSSFSVLAKSFYFRLYEIIKIYLMHKENDKKIISLTTHQFEKKYTRKPIEDFDFYLDFFNYADRVKFTDFSPDKILSKKYLEQFKSKVIAYQTVVETEKKNRK